MEKKIINTSKSPAPIGPYNQAILKGNTLYISGQIALNGESMKLNNKSISDETHQVMKNLKNILEEAKMSTWARMSSIPSSKLSSSSSLFRECPDSRPEPWSWSPDDFLSPGAGDRRSSPPTALRYRRRLLADIDRWGLWLILKNLTTRSVCVFSVPLTNLEALLKETFLVHIPV